MRHVMKNGATIELSEMSDSHLINTIRLIERRAKEGIQVYRGGGYDSEDMWYDEWTATGDEALTVLHYREYLNELERRRQHDRQIPNI